MSGGRRQNAKDAFGGGSKGGARPQTAEIIKTFGERFTRQGISKLRTAPLRVFCF